MKRLKTAVAVIIAAVMLLSMTGCESLGNILQGQKGDMWHAVYATIEGQRFEAADLFETGVTVELKRNGKCVITVDGSPCEGEWDCTDGVMTISGFLIGCTGRMEPDVMYLYDFMSSGMDLMFTRDGAAPDIGADPTATIPAAADPTQAPAEREGMLGRYLLHEAIIEGVHKDNAALAAEGLLEDSYILFDEEAWGELSFSDQLFDSFSYDEAQSVLYFTENDPFPYTLEGDIVTLELPGWEMTLMFKYDPTFTVGVTTLAGSWEGWLNCSSCVGEGLTEGYQAVYASIDKDDTGRWYFEVYQYDYVDGDMPLISMWLEDFDMTTATTLMPDIGEDDAWVLDTCLLESEADEFRQTIADDGSLTIEYSYIRHDFSASCLVTVFLRPYGAEWYDYDILPPGFGE